MRDIKKEVEELFKNMSDDEFDSMLIDAGFEVEHGNGEVIFKDTDTHFMYNENSTTIKYKVKTTFKLNQKAFTTNSKDAKINSFTFLTAC